MLSVLLPSLAFAALPVLGGAPAAYPVEPRPLAQDGPVQPPDRPGRLMNAEDRERNRPALVAIDDPAAAAAGAAALERSQFALGALAGVGDPGAFEAAVPINDLLPGIEFQSLYTEIAALELRDGVPSDWRPRTRVPMFARHRPDGDGYVIGEFVRQVAPDEVRFVPDYTRFVQIEDRTWTESRGQHTRSTKAINNARSCVLRSFALGAWPLAIAAWDARAAALPESAAAEPGEPLNFELRFDRKWRPLDFEWIQDYYLALDPETFLPIQLQFHVVQFDRANRRTPVQWAFVDFEGWAEVPLTAELQTAWRERVVAAWRVGQAEGAKDAEPPADQVRVPTRLLLPSYQTLWRNEAAIQLAVESTAHAFAPLPPGSTDLPWLNDGRVWKTDERADRWDPPPPGERDAAGTAGSEADAEGGPTDGGSARSKAGAGG